MLRRAMAKRPGIMKCMEEIRKEYFHKMKRMWNFKMHHILYDRIRGQSRVEEACT